MKKYSKIIVLISISIIILTIMYFTGKIDNDGDSGIGMPNSTSSIVLEFEKDCNKIGLVPWNMKSYISLKSKLDTYSNGTSASISPEQTLKLKVSLEQQYAESMNVSFQSWLQSEGNSNIDDLYNVMSMQKFQNGCAAILEVPISIISGYKNAFNIPNQLNNFLKNEFDENVNASILNNLNIYCNNIPKIRNFPAIQNIKNQVMTELKDFKIFTDNFNEGYSFFRNNPTRTDVMLAYCPTINPSIVKYEYYLNKIQNLQICN